MPWRLIQLILICIVLLLFVAFNLGNKCNINFGFTSIPDVPVFLTVFAAFVFGMLCTTPYIIALRLKNKKSQDPQNPEKKHKKSQNKKIDTSPKNDEILNSDNET